MDPSDQNNNPASSLSSRPYAACAACRYQRRKCTPECLLAPYFPAERSKEFQNVHNLYGQGRIKKMLKKLLDPTHQKIYIESLIYHANMWEKYPTCGCCLEIYRLRNQNRHMERELQAVRQQLIEIYDQHYYHQHHHQQQLPDQLELGVTPSSNNIGLQLFNQMPQPQDYNNLVAAASLPMYHHHHQQHESYDNSMDGVPNFWGLNIYDDNNSCYKED